MTYQVRQRDPLFDANMQAALEKRGTELLGLAMFVAGFLFALMLASYSPEDPSWLSATEAPVQNWMGRLGASVASPLLIIVGWGSWGLPVILSVWGARLLTHRGDDRILGRIIFAPIAIAIAAVYASTHVPSADWTHSFGLGGLFGDTILGAIVGVAPVKATFGLKLMSAIMGMAMVAMGLFVLGYTWPELRKFGRFLLLGFLMAYDLLIRGLLTILRGTIAVAINLNERRLDRRENAQIARAEEAEAAEANEIYAQAPRATTSAGEGFASTRAKVRRAGTVAVEDQKIEPLAATPAVWGAEEGPPKSGLFALMPNLLRRQAEPLPDLEPELIEPGLAPEMDFEAGGEARIKAKIADVIKSRSRSIPTLYAGRAEPPVQRDRTAGPMFPIPDGQSDDASEISDGFDPAIAPRLQQAAQTSQSELSASQASEPHMEAPMKIPTASQVKPVVQHSQRKPTQLSRKAQAESQPGLKFDESKTAFEIPPLSLLANPSEVQRHHLSDESLEENARMLENVLDDYGVKGEIVAVRPGPVVTMYELEPAPGLKASRVIGLADDIARSMSALSARVSTVPGRSVIGIELPNVFREKVVLREILSARDFGDSNMRLPLALGKNIGGDPVVVNLAKMPHLLIAGTTGSGKSVAINTMILSLLYKLTPEECRLIMIDPKMLELSVYDGIPHLLSPVVTDPKKAVVALKWVVGEMEERYRKMSKMGVRNIDGYNGRVREALSKNEMFSRTVQTGFDDETGDPVFETEEFAPVILPYIVVVVDEMADLMMVAGKEIEACIQRLAQMARASGIHLIMATQRPSVDVITGTIKANFPTRISFQVTSKIDSRTILGEQGAEQLLGMGDMLYMAGGAKITRVHGPFCSDEEVEEIVNFLKGFGPPEYLSGVVDGPDEDTESSIDLVLGLGGNTNGENALYDQAVAIVIRDRKCSTSYIQRKLAIGYNKAARLVEQMEDENLVSAANHVGKREILIPEQH